MEWIVRAATVEDADSACAVLRRSITECCAEDHKNDAAILESWLKNKTPQNLRAWFANPRSAPLVAEMNGSIVGVALMSATGEVALCYLLPETRFVGVGKALLSAIEREAERRGLDALHLASTATARSFYLRNGFAPDGEPTSAFGIVAFPMRKSFSHATRRSHL